eukprot:640318_1
MSHTEQQKRGCSVDSIAAAIATTRRKKLTPKKARTITKDKGSATLNMMEQPPNLNDMDLIWIICNNIMAKRRRPILGLAIISPTTRWRKAISRVSTRFTRTSTENMGLNIAFLSID